MISGVEKVVEGDLVYCEEAEHRPTQNNNASPPEETKVVVTDGNEGVDDLDPPDPEGTSEDIHKVKVRTSIFYGVFPAWDLVLLPNQSLRWIVLVVSNHKVVV